MERSWSVVIPCWRPREDWLHDAIHGALSAGCHESDVILVADGPDAGPISGIVGKRFPACRIYLHSTNRGVAAARRTGLENVNTRLVTFVDQDDYFTPAISRARELAEQNDGVAVVGNMMFDDEGVRNAKLNRVWVSKTREWTRATLDLMLVNAQIGRWVMPTDLARKAKFLSSAGTSDDRVFLAQIASATRILMIPEAVLVYRRHCDQTSHRVSLSKSEMEVVEEALVKSARKRHWKASTYCRLKAARYFWQSAASRARGAPKAAILDACRAAVSDPSLFGSELSRRVMILTVGSSAKAAICRIRSKVSTE